MPLSSDELKIYLKAYRSRPGYRERAATYQAKYLSHFTTKDRRAYYRAYRKKRRQESE